MPLASLTSLASLAFERLREKVERLREKVPLLPVRFIRVSIQPLLPLLFFVFCFSPLLPVLTIAKEKVGCEFLFLVNKNKTTGLYFYILRKKIKLKG